MKKYEVMYIVRPNLESEAVKAVVESMSKIFTDNASTIVETKEIGLKDLAYEISGHKKGYYVWQEVEATKEAVAEFSRIARINEDVIRDIVVAE